MHSLHKAQQSRLRTTNFIDSILSHRTGKGQLRDRQIDPLRESPRKKPEATADVPAELYNHRIPLPAPLHRLDELPPLLLRHENRGDLHLIGAVAIGIARIFGVTCGGAATRVSRYPSFHAFHDEERPQAYASKLFAKMPHSRECLLHNEVMNVGKDTVLLAFREGCKRAKFGEIRRNSVRISS